MIYLQSEKFSTYSHFVGAIVGYFYTGLLLAAVWNNPTYRGLALVYGLSSSLVFTASALYHSKKKVENGVSIWRKIDHSGIFVGMAGSFTPLVVLFTDGPKEFWILFVIWLAVILGLLFKIFYMDAPRKLSVGIYLLFGLFALLPIVDIVTGLTQTQLILFIVGLVVMILGMIIYATKKPDIHPGVFGFHELFHVFVLVAFWILYIMMYMLLTA